MSEKSEKTKKKLGQNADKITIAVLAIIFLGLGYMYFKEQNSPLGSVDTNGKPAALEDKLADSPALEMLKTMTPQPAIPADSPLVNVAQYSMFDPNAQAGEAALEQSADANIAKAKQQIEAKDLDAARQTLQEVLKVARYKTEAVKMLDEITTKPEVTASSDATVM